MTAALSLPQLARALGGEVSGRQALCPGPGHSARDRSLAVRPSPDAPDGLVIHSHAGDDWRVCRDYVKQKLGLPRGPAPERPHARVKLAAETPADEPARRKRDTRRAIDLWQAATPIAGTPAAVYLVGRGIAPEVIDGASGHALRFLVDCPRGSSERVERLPAMLALIVSAASGEPLGVHRTFIDPDGRGKIEHGTVRMVLGGVGGGVVKLSPDEEVGDGLGLGIAEGVETALSVLTTGWRPVWATIMAGNVRAFPLLPNIRSLTVFADHDANGAGQAAAAECLKRWRAAGREARAIMPAVQGHDWNDALTGGAA